MLSPESALPHTGLKDSEGREVNFDMLHWNQRQQDYNYEKPHRHNFHQVMIFYKGGGTHDIDFASYKARSHSVHFVASNNVHLVLRDKGSTGCSLLFTTGFIDQVLVDRLPFSKTNPVLQLSKSAFKVVTGLLDSIKAEYAKKQEGYEDVIQAYTEVLMLNLLRTYHSQHPEEEEKNRLPVLVSSFMQLVQKYYASHYSVEQYALELHISAKHLIEECKKHTGKTPLNHIREYVIAEAKKLLYHTQLSVKEVAYKLNFDEPANFSKYFKAATGYTPAEYREGVR